MGLVETIGALRDDPALFVEQMYGAKPDPWQRNVMEAVARGDRQVSVRSCHGPGKTALLAWLAPWFITTRYHAKVVMTAPTASQLHDTLLPEMKGWINQMPPEMQDLLIVKSDRVEFKPDPERNFISARTSRAEQPDALQGVHADHVLLVVDEASGVPEQVFEAAGGSMSSDHATMLLTGNPVRASGYFYDTHKDLADTWTTFHVSHEDSPRVSEEWVREMLLRYGERSNAFRIRCMGEFPLADDDTVMPIELLDSAVNRDVAPTPGSVVWGLDVARYGADASALCKRQGNTVTEPVKLYRALNTMELVGRIHNEWRDTKPEDRPSDIMVDAIGLGAGVADRLRELDLPARAINVSESPSMGDLYLNQRAELWYRAREWLERRDVRLPPDDETQQMVKELSTVRYTYTSAGKIKIESKEDLKKRGVRSPDAADAFVLTFAGPAGIAIHGFNQKRRKPIRRKLGGIV